MLSNLVITKILSVSRMYTREGCSNKRENRECWGLIYKISGETEYICAQENYTSNHKNIMLLPAGSSYAWKCTKAGFFMALEFDAELRYQEIFCFHVKDDNKILKIFNELEYSRALKAPFHSLKCINGTYSILLELLTTSRTDYSYSSKYSKIKQSVEYIAANYTKKLTNDEISNVSSISTVYFRKIFTEIFGMSPIKYLHKIRTDKAKEMLASDYSSIEDIAFALGYSSVYHFSKTFKQHTGISPSKFPKSLY